ncbi:pyridoxamine 5'-phosphate oxidase family protein [Gammaproteobacteria bacterium]|jgi:nitroimidazol reductase NimA-like FMN-containing flavoprotein (pyridoxamine 5'-phosphate oxidase superfamily)|nr:pyridoxamine 5'-phosphate oxidase family protein [Gammaproteobacteria bacterium]
MTAMTQDEKQSYLADLHVGVLAINQSGSGPLTVPIWYDYTPGENLWMITGTNSRKGKLLNLGDRVSLAAQSESPPYKYVSVEGPIIEIKNSSNEELLAMATRYLGEEQGKAYAEANSSVSDGLSIIVSVKPERWLAVDYSKY